MIKFTFRQWLYRCLVSAFPVKFKGKGEGLRKMRKSATAKVRFKNLWTKF